MSSHVFLSDAARALIEENCRARCAASQPYLQEHYADVNSDSPVYTEMVQFETGNNPKHYFLCLADPAGKVVPQTLWPPEVIRPHHFLTGKAASILGEALLVGGSRIEKLPQQPDKPGLQLYRYHGENGRTFTEQLQFACGENWFLALQDEQGQLLGDSLWRREQLHADHELSQADFKLLAGSTWSVVATECGAHLCKYVLPDGQGYREFLHSTGHSGGRLVYFLGLEKLGCAPGEANLLANPALMSL